MYMCTCTLFKLTIPIPISICIYITDIPPTHIIRWNLQIDLQVRGKLTIGGCHLICPVDTNYRQYTYWCRFSYRVVALFSLVNRLSILAFPWWFLFLYNGIGFVCHILDCFVHVEEFDILHILPLFYRK